MSPETATHIDGTQLVPWLAKRLGVSPSDLAAFVGPRWETRIRRWRNGGAAQVATVDHLLCEQNVCLGELPDDLYRDDPRKGNAPYAQIPPDAPARIARLGALGWTIAEAACIVGVSHTTVRRHSKAVG